MMATQLSTSIREKNNKFNQFLGFFPIGRGKPRYFSDESLESFSTNN